MASPAAGGVAGSGGSVITGAKMVVGAEAAGAGAATGVSDAGGAASGAGADDGSAGGSAGLAVTGWATVEVALLGRVDVSGANGGVAVEGTGIAGLAGPRLSWEVMTFDDPGGTAAGVSAVGAASCATRRVASARLRALTACTLFGSNCGGFGPPPHVVGGRRRLVWTGRGGKC